MIYDEAENQSWKCYCCRSSNTASFVYQAYNLNVSNRFSPLACIPGDDSVFLHDVASSTELFQPGLHSTPKTPRHQAMIHSTSSQTISDLNSSERSHSVSSTHANNIRIAVVNANSVKGRRAELAELCDSTQPDIMVVTETKLAKHNASIRKISKEL